MTVADPARRYLARFDLNGFIVEGRELPPDSPMLAAPRVHLRDGELLLTLAELRAAIDKLIDKPTTHKLDPGRKDANLRHLNHVHVSP